MKIHTVFVTHDRLELTRMAVSSYLATVTVPHTYCVVDNASGDGTPEWLARNVPDFVLLLENRYPGYACNRGYERAPDDATILHRADNDFAFLPGWCDELSERFEDPTVGQVGLRTDEEEQWAPINVGGCNAIRRDLFDRGLRYDERPWPQLRDEVAPGWTEDSLFTPAIVAMGYRWTRVRRPCVTNMATNDVADPYYRKTHMDRGILPDPAKLGG